MSKNVVCFSWRREEGQEGWRRASEDGNGQEVDSTSEQ